MRRVRVRHGLADQAPRRRTPGGPADADARLAFVRDARPGALDTACRRDHLHQFHRALPADHRRRGDRGGPARARNSWASSRTRLSDQVPGISDQLDINSLVANAGTVGLVAGALLLFTGIGWVGSLRECLRAVWERGRRGRGEPRRTQAQGRAASCSASAATALASVAASALGSTTVGWTADRIGLDEGGAEGVVLQVAAVAIAVVADFLLLLYMLTLLPGAKPPRRRLVVACLIGAVGFELLKLLLSGYIQGVASRSMYGAFGVPIALLLWINFTCEAAAVLRGLDGDSEQGGVTVPGQRGRYRRRSGQRRLTTNTPAASTASSPPTTPSAMPTPPEPSSVGCDRLRRRAVLGGLDLRVLRGRGPRRRPVRRRAGPRRPPRSPSRAAVPLPCRRPGSPRSPGS